MLTLDTDPAADRFILHDSRRDARELVVLSHFSGTRTLAIGRDPLARSSTQRCVLLLLPHPPPPSDDCECAVAFRSCYAHLFDTRGVMCLTRHPDLTAAACPTHHPSSPTQMTSACNTLARTPLRQLLIAQYDALQLHSPVIPSIITATTARWTPLRRPPAPKRSGQRR
ncbi:hypothetical protein K438DRAFT_2026851 [Mycena galopus ATCC 62051]|nr:hypothetical protein K438DRAFT_2026851 [Mycena galopus ATCC 62051]